MKELWYERAAMRGEPMPEELNFIDCWMFQSLAALYFRFFQKAISQEQGKEEKKRLYRKYNVECNLRNYQEIMCRWHVDLRKNIEAAHTKYIKARTLEAADALSLALDGRMHLSSQLPEVSPDGDK